MAKKAKVAKPTAGLKLHLFVPEFIGTSLLACTVVGSGIMGENLSTNTALALLINAVSTVMVLVVLITIIGPLSGAHFNPAVSLLARLNKSLTTTDLIYYTIAQVSGAIIGVLIANRMFELEVLQVSNTQRATFGTFLSEIIATAGLTACIAILLATNASKLIPTIIPLWIGSAYFFTSSTSFANPALTIGRVFTDTFAGINPNSVITYILAQLIGALVGYKISKSLPSHKGKGK
jgi:glycerol uptake facilitator-like aquaporin